MNSEFLKRVSIVCILAALLGETSLRLLISEEREGGLYLAGKRLRPYKFPSTQMQAQLASTSGGIPPDVDIQKEGLSHAHADGVRGEMGAAHPKQAAHQARAS